MAHMEPCAPLPAGRGGVGGEGESALIHQFSQLRKGQPRDCRRGITGRNAM